MLTGMTGTKRRVAVLGAGTVGGAVLGLIKDRPELNIDLGKVLVRDLNKPRGEAVKVDMLTTDPQEALDGADIVVELLGGTGLASELMLEALKQGKRVVTANKAVLAEQWPAFKPYLDSGHLYFEASVMAGTPVIGPLTGALRGSRPLELHAILNGTCNYIIGQLEDGVGFEAALAEAQRLGYAEADPSLDVDGFDAAHKLCVLARLAFDPDLAWGTLQANTIGIRSLTPALIKEAMEDGGRVRLVASIFPQGQDWQAKVRPVFLPARHPLAGSASNRNGLLFKGDAVGEVMITGAGAGAAPTGSAVLGDLISALEGRPGPSLMPHKAPLPQGYQADELGEVL